jgi:hypothetical protein
MTAQDLTDILAEYHLATPGPGHGPTSENTASFYALCQPGHP